MDSLKKAVIDRQFAINVELGILDFCTPTNEVRARRVQLMTRYQRLERRLQRH